MGGLLGRAGQHHINKCLSDCYLCYIKSMSNKLTGRGGAGRGQGRKPLSGPSTAMATTTIRLHPEQREKLVRLGGSGWVRSRIDATCEADSTSLATNEDATVAPMKTASSLDGLLAQSATARQKLANLLLSLAQGKVTVKEVNDAGANLKALTRKTNTEIKALKALAKS